MRKTLIITLAFGLMSIAPLLARTPDPVKLAPNIYKVLLDEGSTSGKIRCSEIKFDPRDIIGLHCHPDYFVYALNPGSLKFTAGDGSNAEVNWKEGEIKWFNDQCHSTENIGGAFRGIICELAEDRPLAQE